MKKKFLVFLGIDQSLEYFTCNLPTAVLLPAVDTAGTGSVGWMGIFGWDKGEEVVTSGVCEQKYKEKSFANRTIGHCQLLFTRSKIKLYSIDTWYKGKDTN